MSNEPDEPLPDAPSILSEVAGLPLPPAVRRSLWKSGARVIGSAGDLVTAFFEHGIARVEATTDAVQSTAEARRLVKIAIAKKVPDRIASNEALLDRATAYLGTELLREQSNRERILAHAVADLRSSPPVTDPGRDIDDDWLHSFIKDASTKSTPDMQLLFGKILAGEIRTPGVFTLRTVRTLGMMTPTTAQQFQRLCNISLVVPSFHSPLVIGFGATGNNALVHHGFGVNVLNDLNANDLIYSEITLREDLRVIADDRTLFDYAGETMWLKSFDDHQLDLLSDVDVVAFSTVGAELRTIVSMEPDPAYSSWLIHYFEEAGCALMKMLGRTTDGSLIGRPYRDIRPRMHWSISD